MWALTLTLAGLLGLYAQLVPTYHGPDEPQHVDMLFAASEPGGWPAEAARHTDLRILASAEAAGFAPGHPARGSDAATPRGQRPTFAEIAPAAPSEQSNQMWQHPPLAYTLTAIVLGLVSAFLPPVAGLAHDQVVGLARLLTAATLLPLPALAYWTARRLAPAGPAPAAAAVVPVAVPGLVHIGATVTNDALLILLVGAATLPLTFVVTGDLSVRTGLIAGAVTGLALLTKGFALFVPAWVAAAYVLVVWRGGAPALGRAAPSAALGMLVLTLTGGWWWVRNVVMHGDVQPRGSAFARAPAEFVPDAGDWVTTAGEVLIRTFWGHFGWVEAQLPWVAIWIAVGVLLLGMVAAFAARRRADTWRPGDLGLLLVPAAATVTIMAYGSWTLYLETGRVVAVHGRYVMPATVGMAATAGIGLAALLPRRWQGWWLAGLLLVAGLALHAVAFLTLLERYWTVEGASLRDAVASMFAWSAWPRGVHAVFAVLAAAGAGWCIGELGWTCRPRHRSTPDAPA